MPAQKAKFTWHYYAMAFGVLMALLGMTLSAWGAVVSALGFSIISHPALPFKGLTRFIFLALFVVVYILGFPDASVVQEMMATDISKA
jgi:hypothetical protein